jgi:hypothetical protein
MAIKKESDKIKRDKSLGLANCISPQSKKLTAIYNATPINSYQI